MRTPVENRSRRRAAPLLLDLRRELKRVAVAANAQAMQAYMKSDMPYHGVSAAAMRAACRRVFAAHPIVSAAAWRRDALALWGGATHREGPLAPAAVCA